MQKTFIVTYDAHEDTNYESLYEALKSYKTWAKITESTWAIVTDQKATEVRDKLVKFLPKGSRLFLVKSASIAAWRNPICSSDWLKKHL